MGPDQSPTTEVSSGRRIVFLVASLSVSGSVDARDVVLFLIADTVLLNLAAYNYTRFVVDLRSSNTNRKSFFAVQTQPSDWTCPKSPTNFGVRYGDAAITGIRVLFAGGMRSSAAVSRCR